MRKKLLMKSLLVAAALCVGGNAWADTVTRYLLQENYDDQTSSTWTPGDNNVSYDLITGTDYSVKFYNPKSGNRAFYRDITADYSVATNGYTVEFDFSMWYGKRVSGGNTEYKQTQITLNAGSNVLFQIGSVDTSAGDTNEKKLTVNGTQTDLVFAEGTWYHFKVDVTGSSAAYTITSGEDAFTSGSKEINFKTDFTKLNVINGRNGTVRFNNLSVHYEADINSASKPSITLTGLNGTERTYTITYFSGETLHYVLPGGSEQTVSTGTSAVVSTSTSGTLRAWTTSGTSTSDEATVEVAAENVTLAAPWIYISGMAANETKYNVILDGGNSQESVLLQPTATQSAKFTPDGGVAANVSLPYTAVEKGVLTVTVSAEGYTSASTSFNVENSYVQTWQSADFSSLVGAEAVQTALGGTWTLQDDHGRWASWDKTKDGSYNFYATNTSGNYRNFNDNIYFRDVVVLAEGMGLGRNVTGGEDISVSNTKANQIVGFEIYNGYGNDIVKGTNTYMSYSLCDGTNRPSMSSTNGALLVQATIYSPALVSPTIGSTGYATYASDYALDFSAATGVKAYKATAAADGKVTMAEVTGTAAAGEGLFLQKTTGEISIPVVATGDALTGNLLVRGTGAAVEAESGYNKYVLGEDNGSVSFFLINATAATVAKDKAYLKVAAGTGSRLAIVFDDETTGIATVENASVLNENYYNLNGQRIVAPQKGLYIVNGKKVVIK